MLIKKLVTEVKMPEDLFHETLKLIDDFTLLNFIRDIHKLKKEDFLFAKDSEDIFQELHEEGKVNIGDQAYYAPHTLVRLYRNLEKHLFFSNIYLNLGNGSNIQELRATVCAFPKQRININIGKNSSLAHGVRFSISMPSHQAIKFDIGDNVFVGIGTDLNNGLTIQSGEIDRFTSIGFGVILERGCNIGGCAIIGDGATIGAGVHIPSNSMVLPGRTITQEVVGNIITLERYLSFQDAEKNKFNGIIRLEKDEDRHYIDEIGPLFKFLEKFNRTVLGENHLFPNLYGLIKKYHKEQYNEIIQKSGGKFVNINLPKNMGKFLYHYYIEAFDLFQNPKHKIKKYEGEFTEIKIDNQVKISEGGIMYNIGNTTIKGDTTINGIVVNRSGDEGGSLFIEDCEIEHGVVFHAKGEKKLEDVHVGRRSIIHGKTKVSNYNIGEGTMIHASNVVSGEPSNEWSRYTIGNNATIVGAKIKDSSISRHCRMTGHDIGVKIKKSEIGAYTTVRDGVLIEQSIIGGNIEIPRGAQIKDVQIPVVE